MKKFLVKLIKAPFLMVKYSIIFILQFVAIIFISIGLLIYGISFFIKDYKTAVELIKETVKKLIENG